VRILQRKTRYVPPVGRALALLGCALCLAQLLPESARAQSAGVVFLLPEGLPPESRNALQDALTTQLSLVDVQLVLLTAPAASISAPLEERVVAGKALAQTHSAVGVLWLDARPTDHWFVYAMDAGAEHIVVRPLLVRAENLESTIEAVAVIARGAAEALLHGEPVRGESTELASTPAAIPPPVVPPPVVPPPAAPLPAVPPPAPKPTPKPTTSSPTELGAGLRLSAGYVGTTLAPQRPWQSGLQLSAAWLWSKGPYLGLAYEWFPPDRLQAERLGQAVAASIARHPVFVTAGYRRPLWPFVVAVQASASVDVLTRHTLEPTGKAQAGDSARLVIALTPAARAELPVTRWLSCFLDAGLDVLLNNFKYISDTAGTPTLLAPNTLRFHGLVGVEILH
jgi:hypothetical protein